MKSLKEREKRLSPSTIRKRVEALGRALDWYFISERHKQPKGTPMPVNVLRLLPDGYSLYEGREKSTLAWKPEHVLRGTSHAELLNTYGSEVVPKDGCGISRRSPGPITLNGPGQI